MDAISKGELNNVTAGPSAADNFSKFSGLDQLVNIVEAPVRSDTPTNSKKGGRRGRKPARVDQKLKLERSRLSARECRARKKLRYQYLEELIVNREHAVCKLREVLDVQKKFCEEVDRGHISEKLLRFIKADEENEAAEQESQTQQHPVQHSEPSHTVTQATSFSGSSAAGDPDLLCGGLGV